MKAIPCMLILGILAGCGPSAETRKAEDRPEYFEDMRRYEGQFQPSEYDQDVEAVFTEEREAIQRDQIFSEEIKEPEVAEITQGFRVQLFASTSIDESNAAKAEAEMHFTDEWFYIVYDPPTYKLRAGNFLTRFDADKFARQLADKGYRDAWVVPEKVYRKPRPRPRVEEK